ncbi:hypothetical protein M427DRAFT_132992 [Gonapodya prolifera JEL478]|uniref:SET domain-containing protein n=1 Tax=Gonapodya prolifera (strain JEL478) TaxID=1344416 RepID=A0A139ANN6_GONPJ|nr:hypothetical protein M427DRAFT_132992 [Gonapodya prolifera JEL478]|eukprot:KXS18254.1 hypothetical protein M427DRAFT_132992 [Gonapodya prolifera JEL478]
MVDVDNVASSPSAKHGKSRKARESLDGSEISFRDLSDYDDVCCELFLDKALLGFRTYKMNPISNHQAWLLPDIDHLGHFRSLILPIVRMGMLGKRDLSWTTEHVIRALVDESWERNEQESEFISERVYGSFRKFMSIKSSKQMAQFREHVNRYLLMYHPQAGYEISRTYRYSRVSQKAEACILATRNWVPGEQINLCTGYIAILTEEDEDWLSDRDFSVITLSSKKASSLFLGPARFVNHDCEPNCVFTPQKRTNIIWFTVVRPIGRGEEITASYGDNYFGNENAECLCATCERLQRGGYRSREWSDDLMSQDQSRQSRGARLARASRPRQGVFSVKETFDRIMGTANMAKLSLGGELCITCGQVIDAREERDLGEEEGERTCVRCRRHRALFDQAWPERKSPGMQMAVELVEELAREYRMKRESPQATTEGEESSDMDEDVSFKPRSMLIPPTLATHDSLTGYCSGVFVVSTPVWGAITTKAVAGVGDAPVTMDYVKDKGFAPVLVEKTDEDEVDEDGELEVEIDAGVVEQVLRDVPGGIQVWGEF